MKIINILKKNYPLLILLALGLLLPEIGYCASLETALNNLQSKFLTVILPFVAIFGVIYSGIEMASGSPNGKSHMILSIFGAIVGFLAPAIINFIKSGF
jgi:type IV secretory pathway VirB2 component (pilin)